MSMIRIGYQGEYASNSERAAKTIADRELIDTEEFVPCKSSAGVVQALKSGSAQLGVVAVENSQGGTVVETAAALDGLEIEELGTISLPIKHFLYSRDALDADQVQTIYSHPQALKQCAANIKLHCPDAKGVAAADTGEAAYLLARNEYPERSAVLCTREAGQFHSLNLVRGDMQDKADNITTFKLFRLRDGPHTSQDPPERFASLMVSPKVTEYLVRALVMAAILAAFVTHRYLNLPTWESATAMAGIATLAILFLVSRRRENWANARLIGGYWKYTLHPTQGEDVQTQAHELLRVVHIDRDDHGELRLRGWREGDGTAHRWENKVVMVTPPGGQKGKLSYEYTNTADHPEMHSLDGVVHLSWNRTRAIDRVNRMAGWYHGFATHDVGRIRYTRIDEAEFKLIRFSQR